MREILFRGKDFSGVINHNWCFGCLDITENDRAIIIYSDRFGNKCRVLVNPKTVGQYTGLTDKNGTKIFEGDIVRWCGIKGIIVWEGHKFYVKSNLIWDFSDDDCIEVIGNIHDNPELLRSDTE